MTSPLVPLASNDLLARPGLTEQPWLQSKRLFGLWVTVATVSLPFLLNLTYEDSYGHKVAGSYQQNEVENIVDLSNVLANCLFILHELVESLVRRRTRLIDVPVITRWQIENRDKHEHGKADAYKLELPKSLVQFRRPRATFDKIVEQPYDQKAHDQNQHQVWKV